MAGGFDSLGLMPELIRSINELGWNLPTDVQDEAIPLILGGGDVMAAAETGSGKTVRKESTKLFDFDNCNAFTCILRRLHFVSRSFNLYTSDCAKQMKTTREKRAKLPVVVRLQGRKFTTL